MLTVRAPLVRVLSGRVVEVPPGSAVVARARGALCHSLSEQQVARERDEQSRDGRSCGHAGKLVAQLGVTNNQHG
jgi:hypothetical protein